ncbi:hypothetical protein GBAR_LOCUS7338 [Geodia barretti]|uniref:Uncharacterized protein n=1 Tax=Geodia barretti TaxID=519541 RepID=A0AA35RHN7_GEOBA|nr:hypothetical protein GBAR_LOCUS7338 [Geodia barretti]
MKRLHPTARPVQTV